MYGQKTSMISTLSQGCFAKSLYVFGIKENPYLSDNLYIKYKCQKVLKTLLLLTIMSLSVSCTPLGVCKRTHQGAI